MPHDRLSSELSSRAIHADFGRHRARCHETVASWRREMPRVLQEQLHHRANTGFKQDLSGVVGLANIFSPDDEVVLTNGTTLEVVRGGALAKETCLVAGLTLVTHAEAGPTAGAKA